MIKRSIVTFLGIVSMLLLSAGWAQAQTVGATNSTTTNLALTNGQAFVGQIVTVPSAGLQLQSYTLYLGRNGPSLTIRPEVYEVTSVSGGTVSVVPTPVWTGANQVVTNTGANTFTFMPGVAVDVSKQYVIGVARPTPGENGNVYTASVSNYAGGTAALGATTPTTTTADDLGFSATFAPVPAVVPTLTEWAMILLGLALAGAAVTTLSRRRLA